MATVTQGANVWTTTAGNKSPTAFTPAVGDLIVVITGTTGIAGGTTAVTDNNSGGNGSYVQVGTDATHTTDTKVVDVWVRTAFIASATSTTLTIVQASSTGGGGNAYRVAGMFRAGGDALRSFGVQNNAAAGTPAPVLNNTPLTGNPCFFGLVNGTSPATLTVRTGWTENMDLGYATPTAGGYAAFRASGETTTTQTWGSASASVFAAIAVELDTSAAPSYVPIVSMPPMI